MKTFAAFAAALVLFTGIAPAQDANPEKRAAVQRLMEVTGMTKLADQMMNQMIATIQSSKADLPENFFDIFKKKAKPAELVELIIPIYEKYYSVEELKAVTAFYETPAGKKVLSTMPQVMQEAMQVGQKWGERIGREAAEEALGQKKGK